MKIRIKGNSIRLRLTRHEVEAFARSGVLAETTTFAPGRALTYMLRSSPGSRTISARYHDDAVVVDVPRIDALAWARGTRVGMSADQPVDGGGEALSILIEKDFQCLHGDGPPDPDAYPHPAEA
jgi:hypothetical protein